VTENVLSVAYAPLKPRDMAEMISTTDTAKSAGTARPQLNADAANALAVS